MVQLLALALSLGVAPPGAVRVESKVTGAESDLAPLRGAVTRRLLEGGYALAGLDTPAAAVVTLRRLQGSVLVVIRAGEIERAAEIPAAREDLLRLEVSQHVLVLLEGMTVATTESPSASVGFRGRAPSDTDIERAVAPLVEAGFVVVGEEVPADWAVCITWEESGVVVQRGEAPPCVGDGPPPSAGADLTATVAQQAAALRADDEARRDAELEALADTVPETETEPEPGPTEARDADAWEAERESGKDDPPPRRGWGAVAGFGGAQARLGGEGLVGLRGSGGAGRWGGLLSLTFAPSSGGTSSTPKSLQVLETFVSVGPVVRGRVSPRLVLWGAVLGGIAAHRSSYNAQPPSESLDANLELPIGLVVRIGRGVGLVVSGHAGVTSRTREYREGGSSIWSRSPFRVGGSLGLEFAFGPQEASS